MQRTSSATTESQKQRAGATLRRLQTRLVDLSHRIHANPELAFEEEKSSGWVAEELDRGGFDVEAGICELPTAFVARVGSGSFHIGICAEYDALPAMGHACGHNLIAASAVGAALALRPLVDDLDLQLSVFGTPAEEDGGGKILMLDRGAFRGVHASMMVHPCPLDVVETYPLVRGNFDVRFEGKAAHAAFAAGAVNASDAMTIANVAIGLLRQQLHADAQVHGITTHGGDAFNIIPSTTTARWGVRAGTLQQLERLEERVRACFEGAAIATGCRVHYSRQCAPYSEFRNDPLMADLYRANAIDLGKQPIRSSPKVRMGSTDMANVSQAIPAIQPMFRVECGNSVNHQPEFAAYCATTGADTAMLEAATALAWTGIDVASDASVRKTLIEAASS